MSESVYDRITALCTALMQADGLSATMQSLVESAPAVGDAQTAGFLAEEIDAASQDPDFDDFKADVREQLAQLAAALREVASS